MFARCRIRGLLLLCLGSLGSALIGSTLIGCAVDGLDSIQVTPATQALTVGQTAQFTAVGTFGNAKHLATKDVTSTVTWTSSVPSVATVSAAGIATAVGAGTTTITAVSTSFSGSHLTSTGTLSVTGSSGGSSGGSIVSLAVIPGAQSVASPTQTSQFLAIGTTSSGATVNLSNQVVWSSSSTAIATVGAGTGLATAVGKGTATITAIYSNFTGGTVVTGSASFNVTGGTTQQFTGVSITPNAQSISASGQTTQLVALATSGSTGNQQNVTTSPQIKWSSSVPSIASIGATTGLVTGVSSGNATITALLTNSDGSVVTGTASIAVTLTPAAEPLLSLEIIPAEATLLNLGATSQFIAIGTYSVPPYTRDLTNSPNLVWLSNVPNVMTINSNTGGVYGATAGIATAKGSGTATVIAEVTNPADGTIQTATASFNCPMALPNPNGDPPTPGTCIPGTEAPALLSTLTVYDKGLDDAPGTPAPNWLVTAPSATGVPNVLHCGPGWSTTINPLTGSPYTTGSVCVATYPVGTQVTLTAPSQTGVTFGGWSSNCVPNPAQPGQATGTNTCTVTLTTDDVVGAIFNKTTDNN